MTPGKEMAATMSGTRPHVPGSVWAAGAAWVLLLTAVLVMPRLTHSPRPGDDWTRGTVRLALLYYAVTVCLLLWAAPRTRPSGAWVVARWCWTLAWAAYLIHLGMAFHHYHHWSHADAVRHTREVSGVGEGIYVSHLFTVVWTADIVYGWIRPNGYLTRPPWIGRLLHGSMAFVIFCATVVYETGPIRWAGILLFTALAALYLLRRHRAGAASPSLNT